MPAAPKSSPHLLSAYVLTHNSEPLLRRVLEPLARVADELVIVDSGSTDGTLDIAREFSNRIFTRPYTNFPEQRTYALSLCSHDYALHIDSDEIMSDALVERIIDIKKKGFDHDAYCFKRDWIVLGKPICAMYPVSSPDYPARLLNRSVANYVGSDLIHDRPSGCISEKVFQESMLHITFPDRDALERKLELYTSVVGRKLSESRRPPLLLWLRGATAAPFAFLKWYIRKGGWRDGAVGVTLAVYAARYTYGKYNKAAEFKRARRLNRLQGEVAK